MYPGIISFIPNVSKRAACMKNKNPEGQMDFLSLLSEIGAEPLFPENQTEETAKENTSGAPEAAKTGNNPATAVESFFPECGECWCRDCRHNSKGEAVPREMCGKEMPCPACDSCLAEGHASICPIGSAKEGCMTRAIMEGVFVSES